MLPSPRKAKFDAAKLPYEFSEAALVSRQLMCDGAVIAIGVKVKYLIYDSYPIQLTSRELMDRSRRIGTHES